VLGARREMEEGEKFGKLKEKINEDKILSPYSLRHNFSATAWVKGH